MTADDPDRDARLAEIEERKARRDRLAAQHGMPEHISASDALALARTALVPVNPAPVNPERIARAMRLTVTADDIYASIYRDEDAADAWLESNLVHNGHPALARVPLPDGRVAGILDLRPAMERDRQSVLRSIESTLTDEEREERDAYQERIAAGGCRYWGCCEQGRPGSAIWWECPAGHRDEMLYCGDAHQQACLDTAARQGNTRPCPSCRVAMTPRAAARSGPA